MSAELPRPLSTGAGETGQARQAQGWVARGAGDGRLPEESAFEPVRIDPGLGRSSGGPSWPGGEL